MSNTAATTTQNPAGSARTAVRPAAGKKASKNNYFKKKELIHMFRGLASMLRAQISEDGSIVYVIASDASEMGTGSMGQGDSGMGGQMDSTLYALDRFGNLLWSLDLGQE